MTEIYGQVYTYVQDASGGVGDWVQKGPDFVGDTTARYGLGSSLIMMEIHSYWDHLTSI